MDIDDDGCRTETMFDNFVVHLKNFQTTLLTVVIVAADGLKVD